MWNQQNLLSDKIIRRVGLKVTKLDHRISSQIRRCFAKVIGYLNSKHDMNIIWVLKEILKSRQIDGYWSLHTSQMLCQRKEGSQCKRAIILLHHKLFAKKLIDLANSHLLQQYMTLLNGEIWFLKEHLIVLRMLLQKFIYSVLLCHISLNNFLAIECWVRKHSGRGVSFI